MEFNAIFIGIAIGFVIYYIQHLIKSKLRSRFPPGPYGLPFLGYMLFLRLDIYKQMKEISDKYGKIFALKLGSRIIIVLNDWKSIQEAFINQRDAFSGRPQLFLFNDVFGIEGLISETSSASWKLHKKLVQSTLRQATIGNPQFKVSVEQEVEKFAKYLEQFGETILGGADKPIENVIHMATVNTMFKLIFDERFEYGSETLTNLSSTLLSINVSLNGLVPFTLCPSLKFLSKHYVDYRKSEFELNNMLRRKIEEHKSRFDLGNEQTSYLDTYLQRTSTQNIDQKYQANNGTSTLHLDVAAILQAGVETTAITLSFCILYMITWPDIQARVQLEIDETIGKSTIPEYTDRKRLPYTEAVIMEVHRYCSLAPLGVPHMTVSPSKFCGYDIPANVEVLANLWAVHHDPELWGDPEVFRPERFLDSQGQVLKPQYLSPFSLGARRCLGEELAKHTIFIHFVTLMQKFTLRSPIGHPPPSLVPIPTFVLKPQPFQVIFHKRSP